MPAAEQVVKASDSGLMDILRNGFRLLTVVGIVGGILVLIRRLKKKGKAASKESVERVVNSGALPAGFKRFTVEEVAQHDSETDCWFIHNGAVYDVTKYLMEHPGGSQVIIEVAGKDATAEFDDVGHSDTAIDELHALCIGVIGNSPLPAAVLEKAPAVVEPPPQSASLVTLQPKQPVSLKLVEKITLSHNVRKFRFALPTPEHRLGLPVGKHFTVEYTGEQGKVKRAYTPMTGDEVKGYVDLVVKVYFANEHPKFPQGGAMSQHMEAMKIGDSLLFTGPIGRWEYHGKSNWSWKGEERKTKKYNMIAGGTGITPMLQVVTNMLRDPDDESQVALLFANQSPDDIILRDEIDALEKEHPKRFKRWYTVDRVPEGEPWSFSKGFIDEAMCRERLYPAGDDTINLLCGPPPMLKFACQPNLAKCDHQQSSIFSF